MNELTQKFINEINYLVEKEYDPRVIARYAYEFSLDNIINDKQLKYVVYYIRSMDAGPEFELTKEELLEFINQNIP
ncbi:hypothetical protein [Enterobacter sp.]|uniref:hypothetical protein n=1 Tax=Enterobacter sp. TaxID=42895 RepID=UPI00296E8AD4|nr:hypothetical protein [Enterobacter sp.]